MFLIEKQLFMMMSRWWEAEGFKYITTPSGSAAPQCGNNDDALVAAKSEVGRYMCGNPNNIGDGIHVGIFLIAALGCGDPRYGSGSIGIDSSARQAIGVMKDHQITR